MPPNASLLHLLRCGVSLPGPSYNVKAEDFLVSEPSFAARFAPSPMQSHFSCFSNPLPSDPPTSSRRRVWAERGKDTIVLIDTNMLSQEQLLSKNPQPHPVLVLRVSGEVDIVNYTPGNLEMLLLSQ